MVEGESPGRSLGHGREKVEGSRLMRGVSRVRFEEERGRGCDVGGGEGWREARADGGGRGNDRGGGGGVWGEDRGG